LPAAKVRIAARSPRSMISRLISVGQKRHPINQGPEHLGSLGPPLYRFEGARMAPKYAVGRSPQSLRTTIPLFKKRLNNRASACFRRPLRGIGVRSIDW
jgi:hypothetical protein